MESIAAGVRAATIAPTIRDREAACARIEAQLRAPRPAPPDLARLRAALEHRTEEWNRDLRAEPTVARLLLRRLIGPLEMHDESTRPDWIPYVRWEAPTTPEHLVDGLVQLGASPTGSDTLCTVERARFVPAA